MDEQTIPVWIEFKRIDKSWNSNPGIKYGKFMRCLAERIPQEVLADGSPRIQTVDDVIEWLIEQAVKGETGVQYNYDWALTETTTDER